MLNYLRSIASLGLFLLGTAINAQSIFDSTRVTQSTEVYFASGKYDLDAAAQLAIDSVANFFKSKPLAWKIRISAHTDSIGSPQRNKVLSDQRAQVVQNALVGRGIAADKCEVATFGERKPATANATEQGRQRNRRATLNVLLRLPMTTVAGQITDKRTGNGIQATLIFSTKERQDSTRTDTAGRYAVRLPEGAFVKTEVIAPGYFFESKIRKIYGTPELVQRSQQSPGNIVLTPALPGEVATIKDLFFVGNQAVLLKTSEPELPKVLRFVQLNDSLHIEIAGHINHPNLAPAKLEKWEFELSVNRAKLVFDYLVKNGIDPKRLRYKGYGNSEMKFPKGGTEEEQEQNRRVEIRVVRK